MSTTITLRYAIDRVIEQLREIINTGYVPNNRTWEHDHWMCVAQEILAELIATTDEKEQVAILSRRANTLSNLGLGRPGVSTSWAHYARMIAAGTKYIMDDQGVIGECIS